MSPARHVTVLVDRIRSLLDAGKRVVTTEPLERRVDPRRKVLIKAEVLPIAGYAETRIVNASKTGFAGETFAPLQASHPLIFSVEENQFHQGTVRWVRGRRFGVDLDDALGILGYSDEVDPGFLLSHEARPRRYPVELSGRIALGSLSYRAILRDVSQSGLRMELAAPLKIGQQLIVRLPDRPLILATVRWQADQMVGVETAERMQTLRLAYAGE